MKFYLIEAEDKNPIPLSINQNHGIDIRDISRERFHKLPKHAIVEMETRDGLFFPPVISNPFFMIHKDYIKVINLYDNSIPFSYTKLFCETTSENATYYIPLLPETDCLSEDCKTGKSIVKDIVVKKNVVKNYAIQRIAGFTKFYVLVRMDLADSLLQRGALGIKLTEVTVV